jgi:predicted nucleotidyltransferase
MSDDRRVWIVYVVRPNKENEKVNSIEGGPIEPESSFIDPNADLSSAKLRGIGFGAQTDGSLLFLDLKGHLASVKIVGHTAVKIKPRPAVKREARGGLGAMDLSAASVELIRQWAARTEAVREVWLFGSRAKGASSPDSDVDIGIYLMPPTATSDWALAAYTADGDAWQYELERLLGLPVSLEAVTTNSRGHREVQAGVRLWARTCDA